MVQTLGIANDEEGLVRKAKLSLELDMNLETGLDIIQLRKDIKHGQRLLRGISHGENADAEDTFF